VSVDISSDGLVIVAAEEDGYIYASNDFGATWITQKSAGLRAWTALSLNSAGDRIAACAYNDYIVTYSNGGDMWEVQKNSFKDVYQDISSDQTGQYLVAVAFKGYIYTSSDFGVTWTKQLSAGQQNWWAVASNKYSNGSHVAVATSFDGTVYTSYDYGKHWPQIHEPSISSASSSSSLSVGVIIGVTITGVVLFIIAVTYLYCKQLRTEDYLSTIDIDDDESSFSMVMNPVFREEVSAVAVVDGVIEEEDHRSSSVEIIISSSSSSSSSSSNRSSGSGSSSTGRAETAGSLLHNGSVPYQIYKRSVELMATNRSIHHIHHETSQSLVHTADSFLLEDTYEIEEEKDHDDDDDDIHHLRSSYRNLTIIHDT
jgi:hypothetical protein